MPSAGDWGDIIDEVEAEKFVGREQELESFRQQISLAKPRYLIFYITGQGGAGKSTLLHRYQSLAEEYGFLLAECDELQRDVPAVLGHFAQQLTKRGYPLNKFNKRYEEYRQKVHEIESDPEAPQSLAATIARTVVRAAFIAGDAVPGMRKGLEYIPHEAVATQASEWVTYLTKKFSNKEDVALVREPIAVLAPLFFEDLNKIADSSKVLLCFDNFEATRPGLQEWLLRLREYRPSLNIRISIAGRDAPGGKWDLLQRVTQTIHIDVFTNREAESFLNTYHIRNPKQRQEILELSGRLPVLMSWLAAAGKGEERDIALPTHDIVERFLRWIIDPELRKVALLTAIPRTFNVDILNTLLQNQEPSIDEQEAFEWLQTMPFVQQRIDGLHYHDVVRRMMLSYQRQKSPQMYRQYHSALAKFYDSSRNEVRDAKTTSADEEWTSEQWQKDTLAFAYHDLAANPNKNWEEVLSLLVVAIRESPSFASMMIELLRLDDVSDELTHKQTEMIKQCHQQFQSTSTSRLKYGLAMFDWFCSMGGLSSQAKGYALAYRGECHLANQRWDEALADFTEAANYAPHNAWIIADRGETHRMMRKHGEALADFDQALALNISYVWAFASRGATYLQLGNYQDALADFDHAIALDEKYTWAFANRGEIYFLMGHYRDALTDFDHVIALNGNLAWAFGSRGQVYRQMGCYQEALVDFNRAIALNENYAWAFAQRGETHRLMSHNEEALADFDRAINLSKNYIWAFGCRGLTYRRMGRYQEALTDFDRAILLDENSIPYIAVRGEIYRLMGHYQEALADFDSVLALDQKYGRALINRGQTYLLAGRYQEALDDFDSAIALDGKEDWCWYCRSLVHLIVGHKDTFEIDLQTAIEMAQETLHNNPDDRRVSFNLALYNLVGKHKTKSRTEYYQLVSNCWSIPDLQDAIDNLNDFLALQPPNRFAQQIRVKLEGRITELSQAPSTQQEESTS